MSFRIGVDVGGTFTDVVGLAPDGREVLAKAATTPDDQSEGVLAGLALLADRFGLTTEALLARTTRFVHGTTVATNALLERRGARAAMLTTAGHRDVIEMREGTKPDRYALRTTPPAPLIPRALRLPIPERIGPDGLVRQALDEAALDAAIATLREARAEAVAICFLHAWANPAHEAAAAARLRAALPGVFVTESHAVLPQIKEYERFSTAAANAYVGPAVARYLNRLAERLAQAGLASPLLVILSHGGLAPAAEAAERAAATALSGPAGGVAAALALARRGAGADLVTFDMGGTSTDIALVLEGEAALGRGREIGEARIALESLDIATLGAGGGSIAHLSAGGTLAVGPRSAGARPGPVAYGLGGTEPTVTDANLVLGYLDAARFLGGARLLDVTAARDAFARLGAQIGLGAEACAAGVRRLVEARMADGIRLATIRRGVDPRRAALLAFGGAAGLHAAPIARDLGMARVLAPLFAAGLSAWGMLRTTLRAEASRSVSLAAWPDDAQWRALFAPLEAAARTRLASWGAVPVALRRGADLRYGEQVFETTVPLDALDWESPGLGARIAAAFHARHEALFGWSRAGEEIVPVTLRAAALAAPEADTPLAPAMPSEARPVATRLLRDGAPREVPVFDLAALPPGQRIAGPALLESDTTTLWVPEGDSAEADARGWIAITIGG